MTGPERTTCDATEFMENGSFFGNPATFGPCILRAGHDGPGHEGANGAQWWPNEGADPAGPAETIARLREELTTAREQLARFHEGEEPYDDEAAEPTPAQWVWNWNRATPEDRLAVAQEIRALSGQADRVRRLTWTWDQTPPLLPGQALADLRNAMSDGPQPVYCHAVQAGDRLIRVTGDRAPTAGECEAFGALLDANEAALSGEQPPAPDWLTWLTAMVGPAPVPEPLRGPSYPAPAPDPGPLRAIAEQALAGGSTLPGVRPYSEVKVTTDRVPDELAADSDPPTAEGLYDQLMAVFGVPLPAPVLAPKGSCPCGGGDFDGKSIHAPECPMHPVRLRWAAEAATALLPEEARAAGLHFEYDTTEETS